MRALGKDEPRSKNRKAMARYFYKCGFQYCSDSDFYVILKSNISNIDVIDPSNTLLNIYTHHSLPRVGPDPKKVPDTKPVKVETSIESLMASK